MATGVRNMRGNRRMGSHDKTIVPHTDYYKPPDVTKIPEEEPILDIGKPVKINKVIIHEISLTYEGHPKNPTINVHEIPFKDLVGDPVSQEKMDTGVVIETTQGEKLLVKWHERSYWFQSGVLIHLLSADHTQLYQPNWGNICAVGIEWESEDGTESGVNWASSIAARTEGTDANDPTVIEFNYNKYYERRLVKCGIDRYGNTIYCYRMVFVDLGDYNAPEAIRPKGMCGDPKNRTLGMLGTKLPIRVYPAIGDVDRGLVFCFKGTIMKFIDIEPEPVEPPDTGGGDPTPSPTLTPEFIISTDKVLFTTEPIGEHLIGNTNPYPDGSRSVAEDILVGYQEFGVGEYPDPEVTVDTSIKVNTETIYVPPGYRISFYRGKNFTDGIAAVFENGKLILDYSLRVSSESDEYAWLNREMDSYYQDLFPASARHILYWSEYAEPNEWWYPSKAKEADGSFTIWIRDGSFKIEYIGGETTPPDTGGDTTDNSLIYFCDSSIEASSIDTTYWDIPNWGIDETFYEGLNDLMSLVGQSMLKVDTKQDYYSYLWKIKEDSIKGYIEHVQLSGDWQGFYSWAKTNLGCLTKYQMAGIYMSYHLKIPVLFYNNIALDRYLEGNKIDYMVEYINKTKPFAYDFLTFQDVVPQPSVGAYNSDLTIGNPGFEGFKSYINVEPTSLDFKTDDPILKQHGVVLAANLTDALKPWDYITRSSSINSISSPMWDPIDPVTNPYQSKYWGMSSEYDSNTDGLIAAQIVIHEMGHAIDAYAYDTCGVRLSHTKEFMDISGFVNEDYETSSHEVLKTKGIHETGDMPMTDDGKEAPVSSYGCTCSIEAFAEAFRIYVFNPQFLADKHPQQYHFMETYVRPMTESKVLCPIA